MVVVAPAGTVVVDPAGDVVVGTVGDVVVVGAVPPVHVTELSSAVDASDGSPVAMLVAAPAGSVTTTSPADGAATRRQPDSALGAGTSTLTV